MTGFLSGESAVISGFVSGQIRDQNQKNIFMKLWSAFSNTLTITINDTI